MGARTTSGAAYVEEMTIKDIPLTAGGGSVTIPQLGFGVFQVDDADVDAPLAAAFDTGYRHVDTARIYGNEDGVGRALAATDVPREDIFVTTKLWNDDHGADATPAALDASLRRLGLDTLDLYLIHWPTPRAGLIAETWQAMRELRDAGRTRAIGVCNFRVSDLQEVYDATGEWPSINQVELHPYLQQTELRAFHEEHGIVTEAWSPIGQGGDLLQDETIAGIADKHGVTPAQAVIAWHLASGHVVIPKSVTPSRIEENFASTQVGLDQEDLDAIAGLDRADGRGRIGPDPGEMNVAAVGVDA